MIKAVLFDLDGTVIDTEPLKCLSYAQALRTLRQSDTPTDDQVRAVYQYAIGRHRHEVAAYLAEAFQSLLPPPPGDLALWEVLLDCRMKIYDALLTDESLLRSKLRAPVIEVIARLRSESILTGLVTASEPGQVFPTLKTLNIDGLFDVVLTRGDVRHAKPSPDAYLEAARRLQLDPAACVAVEDSGPGVQAAVAAGMCCVVVPPISPDYSSPTLPDTLSGISQRVTVLDEVGALYPALRAVIDRRSRV